MQPTFVTIGRKQVNTNLILVAEGLQPGQKGAIKLYCDPRAGTFLAGADDVKYTAGKTPELACTVEIGKDQAAEFRQQWNQTAAAMAAGSGSPP